MKEKNKIRWMMVIIVVLICVSNVALILAKRAGKSGDDATTEIDVTTEVDEDIQEETISTTESVSKEEATGEKEIITEEAAYTHTASEDEQQAEDATEAVADSAVAYQPKKEEEKPQQTTETTEADKPEAYSEATTEAPANTTESTEEMVWVDAVWETVWVVDKPAQTVEIPIYEWRSNEVCNGCGEVIAYMDGDVLVDNIEEHTKSHMLAGVVGHGSWHTEYYQVQVDTYIVEEPEEGHYEEVVVKEGYWTTK